MKVRRPTPRCALHIWSPIGSQLCASAWLPIGLSSVSGDIVLGANITEWLVTNC